MAGYDLAAGERAFCDSYRPGSNGVPIALIAAISFARWRIGPAEEGDADGAQPGRLVQGRLKLLATARPAAIAGVRPRAEGEDRHIAIRQRLAVALQEAGRVSMPATAVQRCAKNDHVIGTEIAGVAGSLDDYLQVPLSQNVCERLGYLSGGAVLGCISNERCPHGASCPLDCAKLASGASAIASTPKAGTPGAVFGFADMDPG
jgi:hypothetical protein